MSELSEKDRRFAEAIVYGDSPSIVQAYRDTRPTRASAKNARAEASRLWRSPSVQAYAERLREDLLARGRARAAADRERIVAGLWREAEGADRAADRIAALRILGTVSTVDLFGPDRVEVGRAGEHAGTAAEMAASIEVLLRETIQGAEVEPEDEEDPLPPTPLSDGDGTRHTTHQNAQTIPDSEPFTPEGADIIKLPTLKLDMPE